MAIDLNTVPGEESEEPSIACRTLSSSTMAIDLNKVPQEGSEEPLPDLNQEPADDGDQFHSIKKHKCIHSKVSPTMSRKSSMVVCMT